MYKMNKEQFMEIEIYANDFLDDYTENLSINESDNEKVQERLNKLKETKKTVPEVERKNYSDERKEAKAKYNSRKAQDKLIKKNREKGKVTTETELRSLEVKKNTSEIRLEQERQKRVKKQRKVEDKYEKNDFNLAYWISAKYAKIHSKESGIETGLFPSAIEGKKKDKVKVREGIKGDTIREKIALYKAAQKINSKRSLFSKMFNWAEDYRIHKAMKTIKTSLIEDNNFEKNNLNKVLKFVCKDGLAKYNDFGGIDNNGNIYALNEGPVIKIDEKLYNEQQNEYYEENYKDQQEKLSNELNDSLNKDVSNEENSKNPEESNDLESSNELSQTLF